MDPVQAAREKLTRLNEERVAREVERSRPIMELRKAESELANLTAGAYLAVACCDHNDEYKVEVQGVSSEITVWVNGLNLRITRDGTIRMVPAAVSCPDRGAIDMYLLPGDTVRFGARADGYRFRYKVVVCENLEEAMRIKEQLLSENPDKKSKGFRFASPPPPPDLLGNHS